MDAGSYECGVSDKPLLGSTVGGMLDHIAQQYPDTEALVSTHQGYGIRTGNSSGRWTSLGKD